MNGATAGGSFKTVIEDSFTVGATEETTCQTQTQPQCPPKDECGYDSAMIAMWVVAVVFIIIFSLVLWYGFTACSSWCNKSSKGGKGKKDGGFGGCGAIGAFLIWLIFIILFLCAVWKCGWAAIIGFLILFIILIAICGCAFSTWKDKDECH